jgi:hypothetical protein
MASEPFGEFVNALGRWRSSLLERRPKGRPSRISADGRVHEIPDREHLDAQHEWNPLDLRAIEMSVWLRSQGRGHLADEFDRALEQVRGYVAAYDNGDLDWKELSDPDRPYGPLDHVIEVIGLTIPRLESLGLAFPREVWDDFPGD